MDLRGGWRVKPQTLICTPHRLRYTTAPNPHSTLSHSPITPPSTDRSPLGVSLWLALSSNQRTACCRENKIILNFQLEFGIIS
ncbi:hypothetical protein CROQUDRAFT_476335 [Cronartium quercuum f. sp. fusiforme G11]|uniref:Uncharacterized protein n=1 Tax=Cronartium quercuum f. sp. fusiforme G11 TaxID=708437 RepID=A0A9P6NNJ6_9BASI|nr:hypothetical protein CROQUDRAFT_476335 [Cronartium quercuum f. sp. fusiforme G11]